MKRRRSEKGGLGDETERGRKRRGTMRREGEIEREREAHAQREKDKRHCRGNDTPWEQFEIHGSNVSGH